MDSLKSSLKELFSSHLLSRRRKVVEPSAIFSPKERVRKARRLVTKDLIKRKPVKSTLQ